MWQLFLPQEKQPQQGTFQGPPLGFAVAKFSCLEFLSPLHVLKPQSPRTLEQEESLETLKGMFQVLLASESLVSLKCRAPEPTPHLLRLALFTFFFFNAIL